MSGQSIGGPCPKCGGLLLRRERARLFRTGVGDVAYCARCHAAWDIDEEAARIPQPILAPRPA